MDALADDARAIFDAAVAAVRPAALIDRVGVGSVDGYGRVVLVGAGKAARWANYTSVRAHTCADLTVHAG